VTIVDEALRLEIRQVPDGSLPPPDCARFGLGRRAPCAQWFTSCPSRIRPGAAPISGTRTTGHRPLRRESHACDASGITDVITGARDETTSPAAPRKPIPTHLSRLVPARACAPRGINWTRNKRCAYDGFIRATIGPLTALPPSARLLHRLSFALQRCPLHPPARP